ncbi:hypothetical protein LINPERHAP1_LOCUS2251 [Linum perenne]
MQIQELLVCQFLQSPETGQVPLRRLSQHAQIQRVVTLWTEASLSHPFCSERQHNYESKFMAPGSISVTVSKTNQCVHFQEKA